MNKKQKYYVVWKGRRTGIFNTWDEAAAQVNGFAGAQFKSFGRGRKRRRRWDRGVVVREQRAEYSAKPNERWKQLRLVGIEPPIVPR